MKTKTITVQFDAQSKSATSKVEITYSGEAEALPDNATVIAETAEAFKRTEEIALNAAMRRNR